MHPIVKNVLAVIVGIFVGGFINMQIINLSGSIIPLPDGVDPNDLESIAANMHLYQPKHYIMPFLAHALGTLVGAIVAALIAATHKQRFALGIGFFYLIGGIVVATMIPAPIWFIIVDLVLAYIPMGILGGKLFAKK